MKAFPAALVIRALPPAECPGGLQRYVLMEDFTFCSEAFSWITAPAGMTTDFASVPRLVWAYLSPEDPCILFGSIIHDYLYQVGGKRVGRTFTRAEADRILHEAMLVCGARPRQAAVVHLALRLFGARNFKG